MKIIKNFIKTLIIVIILYAVIEGILYFFSFYDCSTIVKAYNTTELQDEPGKTDNIIIPTCKIIYRTVEITLPNGEKDWILKPFYEKTYEEV